MRRARAGERGAMGPLAGEAGGTRLLASGRGRRGRGRVWRGRAPPALGGERAAGGAA